jgi:hypothetical protein
MATIPTAQEIRDELEGFCAENTILSDVWVTNKRDGFVIPWIEKKTKLSFSGVEIVQDYYDGNGENYLLLNRKPVNSVTRVEYIDSVNFTRELTLTSFTLIPDAGILKGVRTEYLLSNNYPIFPRGNRNIRVTMSVGYAANAIPVEIAEVIKYLTAEKMLANLEGRTGGGDTNIQGYGKSYGSMGKYTNMRNDLTRSALSLLAPYFTGVSS